MVGGDKLNWRIPGLLGLLSCFGSLLVILSYTSFAALRKHPSIMVLFLSISDFMYSIKFVIECNYMIPFKYCTASALWGNFWGMASISWNAMLSVNVIFTLHDPFKGTAHFLPLYHIFVWTISAGTTLALFFNQDHIGYMENVHICGLKEQGDYFLLMFYVPLFTYIIIGFWCLALCARRMSNLKNPNLFRSSQRRSLMKRVILVVLVFSVIWSIPALNRLISFIDTAKTHDLQFFMFFDLSSLGFQGFMNACVWLTNPIFVAAVKDKAQKFRQAVRKRLCGSKNSSLESSHLLDTHSSPSFTPLVTSHSVPSIEAVLRTDVISCLLYGIQDSALGRTKDSSKFNENSEFPELQDETAPTSKQSGFHFLDYFPTVFAQIRDYDGIAPEKYLESLDVQKFLRMGNFKVSDAKSGAFFCIPPDKQYIIKMVSNPEAKFLKKIIPDLASYYKTERNTLIVKFYGFHGVTLPQGFTVHIVVMSNVFQAGIKLDHVYDLKGSWVNRRSKKSHLGLDLDFARKINFTENVKTLFLGQISKDATFLSHLGIMDYSLILGLHTITTYDPSNPMYSNSAETSWTKGVVSDDKTEMYFLGIIDFLQQFNWSKRIEFFAKTKLLCQDSKGLSAVPPHDYCQRFLKAMQNKLVEVEDLSDEYGFAIIDN